MLLVRGPNHVRVEAPPQKNCESCDHPKWGHYCKQGDAKGVAIKCYTCVEPRAVEIAQVTVSRMLDCCNPEIHARLRQFNCGVAIIGTNQETQVLPEFALHRYKKGVRLAALGAC